MEDSTKDYHSHPMLTQLSPNALNQPNSCPTQFLPNTHPTQFSPDSFFTHYSPISHPIEPNPMLIKMFTGFSPNYAIILAQLSPILTQSKPTQFSTNAHPIITQYSHPTMPNTQLLTRPIFHTIEPNPILIKILTQFSPNCNMIISQYSSFFPHIHVILTKI